jgi:hypothetical protein
LKKLICSLERSFSGKMPKNPLIYSHERKVQKTAQDRVERKRQIRQGPLSDVAMFPAQPFIKSVGDFKSELFI